MHRTLRASNDTGRRRANEEITRSRAMRRHDDAIDFQSCGFLQNGSGRVAILDRSLCALNFGDLVDKTFGFFRIQGLGLALREVLLHKSGGRFQHREHCDGATLSQQRARRSECSIAIDFVTRGNWEKNILVNVFAFLKVPPDHSSAANSRNSTWSTRGIRFQSPDFRWMASVFSNVFRAFSVNENLNRHNRAYTP